MSTELMKTARCMWEVRSGILVGESMPEYTKQFWYTQVDYELDIENKEDGKPDNIFTTKLKEAHDYAMQLTNPKHINWVRIDFIWY